MSIIHNLKPATLLSPSPSPSSSSRHTSSFPSLPSSSFKPLISCSNSSLLSRRLFLPSVSGIWDALTGGGGNNNTNEAILAIRRGMSLFKQGDVLGSVTEFDRAIELDPRQKAYLWQRGLSLYYLDRFEEGAEQFRIDVAQNPNDTEESISYGAIYVGRDPRPVMRETYNMFKDGGDPEKLVAAFSNSRESDYFYASLYAGLYYESQKENDAAKVHIVAACQSSYGQRSDDYMASLSKVHCLCRNWNFS
ncbi:Tetratricopeptide repeat (TPR) superfamily protein [Trifolium repens]|nr:Tetratricopeptide repeat (TPR) superfamily protein [Trifolium repens]